MPTAHDVGSRGGAQRSRAIEISRHDVDETLFPERERRHLDVERRDSDEVTVEARAPARQRVGGGKERGDRGRDDGEAGAPPSPSRRPLGGPKRLREIAGGRKAIVW